MSYDKTSKKAIDFIHDETIHQTLKMAKEKAKDVDYVKSIIEKAATFVGLTHEETSVLTYVEDKALIDEMFSTASKIKNHIYGKRIVMFAPLYVSDYCVNECSYCGYKHSCKMDRKKLTMDELRKEVEVLEKMGHKRLALEAGEDPVHCPIEYILECIDTIYNIKKDGEIRRVNINIAATSVEEYKMLKEAGIGTYILFQESYHKETYEKFHKKGPKHNYDYHTTAHDRAMEAGIDDVGFGVLYGLYDWHYEVTATMLHKEHLEAVHGVGPHTISVPRIKHADGVDLSTYPNILSDDEFKRLVSIIRLAVPYTGIILSTRESAALREELLKLGVSQVSAGSATGVGGYSGEGSFTQFDVSDEREAVDVVKGLIQDGYIPSFCTACYREGRTGDRFMQLAKTGQIANVCQANALLTLKEYSENYGDEEFKALTNELVEKEMETIPNPKVYEKTKEYVKRIEEGEGDFRW